MNSSIEQLRYLYGQTSKHSNYQILPDALKKLLDINVDIKSRHEEERLHYMLKQVDPVHKSILDIGGNTGYFSFKLIEIGASRVDYYEGNGAHADFVILAADLLQITSKLKVYNEYFDFNKKEISSYDIVLLLNVLHHIGDDYDDKNLSMLKAKKKIIESLNFFADKTSYMVFQLGFCWKGNRNLLLFENGTKQEMIDFILEGTNKYWKIAHIGIPVSHNGKISYESPDQYNLMRNNSLSEFLNRPIFILKSK